MARTVVVPGEWAKDGIETPVTPVVGQLYRKISAANPTLAAGWPYANVVPSDVFNQFMFMLSSVVKEMEQTGVLQWSALVNYNNGAALVIGSDNRLYVSNAVSGPDVVGVGPKDPVADLLGAYWIYTNIGQGSVPAPSKGTDPAQSLYFGNIWAS